MRRRLLLSTAFAGLALLVLAGSCATTPKLGPDGEPLSPSLRPHSYYEEGSVAFIAVDTQAASFLKAEDEVFPVLLGLSNLTRDSLSINRESFSLEDDQGNRYSPISVNEFNEAFHNLQGMPNIGTEEEPRGIEVGLGLEPGAALAQDVRAVLLDGVAGLFLRVSPWRRKKRWTVPMPTGVPRSASRRWTSTSVT